ncbi:histidine phosphatase family protein [Streptomyces griseomycini]|uniref:Broad specificity phosphatase PhoE n=1 Tax=Streptomyces griseomycini TaxID=66895 RepID=A0A7W7V9J2_9ACTN|nr:histidine phosphatase family protein [Streptomyces griseomycini]MBB4901872.1 broad specificity phosphatase PhoE [Streptomyces griseomycini]GGQ17319.1 phosphoglycerate mutase [Streptomyces griseomycini]GGR40909.1 phosphoglycerate mutase [Streptomyces griseomycini]
MPVSLTFLCAIAANDMSRPIFGDVAVSEPGLPEADVLGAALPGYSVAVRGPSPGCARTAQALAVTAEVEPALRDFDYGEWHGRTVAEIAATDPYGLSALLTDPDAVPHGGESVRQLCRRIKDWLSSLPPRRGHAVAITEPAVIRAALIHALSDPVSAFWHITVPPVAAVTLRSQDDYGNVRFGPTPRIGTGRTPWDHLTSV